MPLIADGKGGMGDVAEAPNDVAAAEAARSSPGFVGKYLGDIATGPTNWLLARTRESQYQEKDWWRTFVNAQTVAATGQPLNEATEIKYIPTPDMKGTEANEKFPGPDGKPLFKPDETIKEGVAETIYKHRNEQFQAESDLERFKMNHSVPVNMIASIPGMLTDPVNAGLAFLPGVGEEAFAAKLGYGLLGRTVGRAAVGAEIGAIQQGAVAGIKLGLADDLHSDYNIRQALVETLMGAALGAGINAGVGAGLIDPLRYMNGTLPSQIAAHAKARLELPAVQGANSETNHAAAQSAIAQIVTGRPVDVTDFFPKPQLTQSETALGRLLNHPFFEKLEPTETGVGQRELAREINPKLMERAEELEKQKRELSDRYQELDRQRRASLDQGQGLVVDQIKQLETQLQGKLSKGRRAQLEQRRQELEDSIKELPGETELASVQQRMQDADNALRDLAPQLTETMGRARETIQQKSLADQGAKWEDLIRQQHDYLSTKGMFTRETGTVDEALARQRLNTVDQINKAKTELQGKLTDAQRAKVTQRLTELQDSLPPGFLDNTGPFSQAAATRDFSGMTDREQGWRTTGIAPGISHDDLVRAIGETEQAAANAPPPPAPQAPPKDWGNPSAATTAERPQEAATGQGMPPAATPVAKTPAPSSTGLPEAFGTLAGGGATRHLYEGLFDSLRQGKDTYAGVRDTVLAKAKAAFDEGLIKSPDDLRALVNAGYDIKKAGLVDKPMTIAEAYPDIDTTKLSAAERKELMDAHRELEAATNKEAAYEQAAYCIKGG